MLCAVHLHNMLGILGLPSGKSFFQPYMGGGSPWGQLPELGLGSTKVCAGRLMLAISTQDYLLIREDGSCSHQEDFRTQAEEALHRTELRIKSSILLRVKINFDDSKPSNEQFNMAP